MTSRELLLELHLCNHEMLASLIAHCADFSPAELAREFDGFGYPSIRLQLHHAIGAEQYWIGVLNGQMLVEEREEDFESAVALQAFRLRVAAATGDYLRRADLFTPCRVVTYGGSTKEVLPANVLLRTQLHIRHHGGQVAAMVRLLDRPVPPGLDYPLAP